ncbi:diguanylate cyclase [Rossellomorea marisflavi]|uniref:diguanylate cyclase n=1 Tax=Rossellomorea marisflavi TaxID=189381 RepID=UPI003D2F1895
MDKYTKHFFENIRKKLSEWEVAEKIPHEEVYRFIHSLAGSASVLGLDAIGKKARTIMDGLPEKDSRMWSMTEIRDELFDIIKACYLHVEGEIPDFSRKYERRGEGPVVLIMDTDTHFLMEAKEKGEAEGWHVVPVVSTEKAIGLYYDVRPDCAILNVDMADDEELDSFKQNLKSHYVPAVMMSADRSKEVRVKAYRVGADDFMAKPVDMDEFLVRVDRQLQRKKHLESLVLIDELTHVYNRKYLQQAYSRLKDQGDRQLCVAILDIDHFKKVNDTYGHLIGDQVLREFAGYLKQKVGAQDIIFRYGGEEFVILFHGASLHEAVARLNVLREDFSLHTFFAGEAFSCTFSAGVAEITDPGRPFEHWLGLADTALYEAKEGGRNRVKSEILSLDPSHEKILKVAIVDDDPIIRTVMSDIVAKLPQQPGVRYDVNTFDNGESFLYDEWHDREQTLVVLDGVMPKMDGLEVLEHLRRRQDSDRYKVIMLTSRRSERDISRSLQLGADDYITKPFKLLELEARLNQILKRMR